MRTLSVLIILAMLLNACSQTHILKGDTASKNLSFKKAAYHYEKALENKDNSLVHAKAAEAYLRMNETEKAEEHYEKALASDNVNSDLKRRYAQTLLTNGKQKKGMESMQQYLNENPNDLIAKDWVSTNIVEAELVKYEEAYIEVGVVPMEGYSNAFSACPSRDGIYFVAERKPLPGEKINPWNGKSFLDVYYATRMSKKEWTSPEAASGEMNKFLHDGPLSLSSDYRIAYISRSALTENNRRKLDEKSVNQLKVVKMQMDNAGDWQTMEDLPLNRPNSSNMHPNICKDDKTLFFASDREGGYGGSDLYMTVFNGQSWSEPTNLGPQINTAGNEAFPFASKKDTLFFASDGHKGMGGLDIFISVFDGKKWSKPQNLKAPINTNFDDFSICFDKEETGGYFSSNRNGKDEIFNWEIKDPSNMQAGSGLVCTISKTGPRAKSTSVQETAECRVHGTVIDYQTKTPVKNMKVELQDKENETIEHSKSDNNGVFSFNLKPDAHYVINGIDKKTYVHGTEISTMGLQKAENFEVVLEVETVELDKSYILNNIYYDYNKYDLRSDVVGDMENLLSFMKENPTVEIELSAHTDARGSSKYNHWLSAKRAKSAMNYLIANGIGKNRLSYKGYGEAKPVNNCGDGVDCSEEKHQENRRLEFKVLKLD